MEIVTYDIAIVGGGPAGLSAALLLGRSRRRVIVCDHQKPRNYAAKAVHGYLGLDGVVPSVLRQKAVAECTAYGVSFADGKVCGAHCDDNQERSSFRLELDSGKVVTARKLLLATGVEDDLPKIEGFSRFYGVTAHHCPYCDGWEHSDKKLVAFGKKDAVVKLSLMLLQWSAHVTCCTNGTPLEEDDIKRLRKYGVGYQEDRVIGLAGNEARLEEIQFASAEPLACDAFFFSTDQGQRSKLPQMLGCNCDEDGLIVSSGKQGSGVRGLFLAGDVDGDVQFAIVAAAEGAIAATAINSELQEEDLP